MPSSRPDIRNDALSLPQPVAIYTRVSTDNQVGGRFDSCESQAAYCREKIEQQKSQGWYEVACLTDAAYSGGTMERPGMRALKRMIEAGEVKIVLIYKLERVLRSTDEWVPFRAFLKKHGCRLESATEDISESTPSGRLKNNLMMSFNQYERENAAEKTKAKMFQQAKRGIWNGGLVPFGYAYDKNTQSLQPNPDDAAIVRRVFEDAARLVSLTDIANALNAEGHRTKERVWIRRDGSSVNVGGRLFRSDGLRLLIRNPIYRGAVKFDGQEFAGQHQGLVSPELWDKANAATVETKPRPIYAFRERDAHNHLLKGLAWCGSCGRALVPNDSGKKVKSGVKYRYYTCSLVMRETIAAPCPVGRLSADALEKAVVGLLGEVSQHPQIVSEMIAASQTMRRGDRDSLRADVARAKEALAGIEKKLSNCAEAVAKAGAGALTEALVRRATELRAERQRLLHDQERARQELALCEATVLEESKIRQNLARLGQALTNLAPEERKELVQLFVERVEVRRHASGVRSSAIDTGDRTMDVRIKLHLQELIRGLQERASGRIEPKVSIRGLNVVGSVDFSHAQRGEVAIVTPFRRTLRLDDRVRTATSPKSAPEVEVEHPILRAQLWQRKLAHGEVASRLALAQRVGVDPAMVTRIMKLLNLAPEIQEFLAQQKTPSALWYFNIKTLGAIADLAFDKQRIEFGRIAARYEKRRQALHASSKTVPIVPMATTTWKHGPKFAAG